MRTLLVLLLCGLLPSVHAVPVTELPPPAPADSGEPSLHSDAGGTVHLTFIGPGAAGGERALLLATLAPGDTAWSAPRPVVSTPHLMENWADFASLTTGSDGQLWAQWFQHRTGDSARGYDGWFARSADGGATWSPPAPLGHEFVSLAPLSGGRVMAVWLQSTRPPRPAQSPAAHHGTHETAGGAVMRLQARLLGPDGATLQDWVIDPDVCSCCQTTLARLSGDRLVVVYRGRTRDEVRDHSFATFNRTGWGQPRRLHADGWKIPACPVNGPAADARDESLAVVWFTAADGVARVQAKQSRDGGLRFGPAVPIDLGRPIGRVDLVKLADDSSLIAWLESKSDQHAAGLYVRRLFPDGALSAPQLVATTSAVRASGFPRLAVRPGPGLPVLVGWTDATPADPANPKSAAITRVRVAQLDAAELKRTENPGNATVSEPR